MDLISYSLHSPDSLHTPQMDLISWLPSQAQKWI